MSSKQKASILAFAVLLLTTNANSSQAAGRKSARDGGILSTQQIARLALPRVVRLNIRDASGAVTASGSGFVVGSDLIVTNAHVIHDATSVNANFLNGRSVTVRGIVATDEDHDLALGSV